MGAVARRTTGENSYRISVFRIDHRLDYDCDAVRVMLRKVGAFR